MSQSTDNASKTLSGAALFFWVVTLFALQAWKWGHIPTSWALLPLLIAIFLSSVSKRLTKKAESGSSDTSASAGDDPRP